MPRIVHEIQQDKAKGGDSWLWWEKCRALELISVQILRVLPYVGSGSGGLIRSTLANCQALCAVDPDVRITLAATRWGLDPGWRSEIERRMPAGMELRLFRAVGRRAFIFSVPMIVWLWRHLAEYDVVVIESLLNPVSTAAARVASRHGVPYMVVPHGMLSKYTFRHRRTWLKKAYFHLVERGTLNRASAVRFTSEAERNEAPNWSRPALTPIIPHPYDSREPSIDSREPDDRKVLFLARFDPKKGFDVLLPAFDRLRDLVPDAQLVLAGAGDDAYEQEIRRELRRLGLANAVNMPGFVEGDEKFRLLEESSVFVLPSQQENFGIAVVEAMDAGTPVVLSRGVGIWREVSEAGAGLVVNRAPEALAEALANLLLNPQVRRRMAASGRELVRRRFDPQEVGRELHDLYRDVATDAAKF